MFHVTERLLLRPAWPEDWQAVFAGIGDEGVVRNLARAPWPYREQDARRFVALPVDPVYPRFLVTRAHDAALVGCIGIDPHGTDVELGYWIAREYWNLGFATEAGHAALELARMIGHPRIVASHFLDNPASGRVLIKLGFEPTGRVFDRHSCGRAGVAPAREFAIDLVNNSNMALHAA